MKYSETFMRQHEEMYQVADSIVFALAEAGHESRCDNIVETSLLVGAGPGALSGAP